ncbi:MAG: CoA transferase [Burkholderiales bacterium]|nr:CoA transferase [Burkholderiales bacterium]
MNAIDVLAGLWADAGLDARDLARARLEGAEPALPSSFAVGTAAQASIAAAALAASTLGGRGGAPPCGVAVDMRAAAQECTGWFSIDGRVPERWDKISGLYACRAGWVRIHANFAHHRDGALRLLGLPPGPDTPRAAVAEALARHDALAFEADAAAAGLVVAAARSFAQWDAHPHARAVAAQPLIGWERIGEAPPVPLPPPAARPLAGIRVLDLTRILAGPVCGRTLAAYGADVLLVNAPHLPNIESIIETSRGKRSCHVDLDTAAGRAALAALVGGAHVFVQGYRPGALAARGFGPADLARLRPGIVCVSLSAYGDAGPWAGRRGFDSLVQTATGFNLAEAAAAGADAPQPLPVQILDYASGFLMAFAAQAALLRQAREGGSWHLRVSLARTGLWLRSLGRIPEGLAAPWPPREPHVEASMSGWGELRAIAHAARLDGVPAGWALPAMPPGTHPPSWSGRP